MDLRRRCSDPYVGLRPRERKFAGLRSGERPDRDPFSPAHVVWTGGSLSSRLAWKDSWYLRLWTAFAVCFVVVLGLAIVAVARSGGASKPTGWDVVRDSVGFRVRAVDAAGPARELVQVGDRLEAVDGHREAARIGPRWYLRDSPERTHYSLTVRRAGSELTFDVPWPTIRDREEAAWQWVHLLSAIVWVGVGLLIAFGRPDSFIARRATLAALLNIGYSLSLVFETDFGILAPFPLALALGYFFVRPMHFVAGYRLTTVFPLGAKEQGGWRVLEWTLILGGLLLWIPSVYGAALRSLGPERAAAIAAAQYPFSLLHDSVVNPLIFPFAALASLANAGVAWRNYRRLPSGDLKRRLRWMSLGIAVSLLPLVVVTPMLFFSALDGGPGQLARTVHIINVLIIISPLSVGYAIVTHRALGFRVVIRAGVRYLLAKNVLRAAIVVPIALLVIKVAANPAATVAELFLGGAGRTNLLLFLAAALALRYRTGWMERIDRRFFREAYQRDRIFVALAESIATVSDIPSLARLLSTQLQDALHPERIIAVARDRGSAMQVVYSSDGTAGPVTPESLGIPLEELRHIDAVVEPRRLPHLAADAQRALSALGIDLIVPIRGPNEGLLGVLLLGAKRSEEPYTGKDRHLLDTAATQTGVVWENLQLRQALSREQGARRQLTARLDGGTIAIVLECPECGRCYDGDAVSCADDARSLVPSLPTARLLDGKYQLHRLVGRGGMGAVYQATDLRLDRTVAVKAILDTQFDDAVVRQRFAREARASARIVHPNVVGVFDLGEFEGGAYLVLEYLEGQSLRQALQRGGPLQPADAARLLADIFDGVEAAHAQQVIHRDLKPENIFLIDVPNGARRAKILDFGLAVARDLDFADGNKLTRTGTSVGTLAYMSPEQFAGEPVDESTDVHALGIVALEMLTGSVELRGPFFARADAVLTERLRGAGASQAQRELADVLARATHGVREDRYGSVGEFRDELMPVVARWVAAS